MDQPIIVFGMNSRFAVRQFLLERLDMVRRQGYGAVVIAPARSDGDPPDIEGVEYRDVPVEREIAPCRDLRAFLQILRVLRQVRPSISDMSTPKMALLGGIAAWLAGVPHRLYTLRGLRYETTRGWKRALLMACESIACTCAHRVICISRSVQEAIVRDGVAPYWKTALLGKRVSEGLALHRWAQDTREVSRQDLGIPDDSAVMGFVGRLTRDKGVKELVDSFLILRNQGMDVRLLLIGAFEAGDPVDAETEQRIRTDPGIYWAGPVPDATPYYSAMDVFVFPTHREGLGRVLLEAAAAGKPVVSTRTTGVVDVVLDGITGVLVPPKDARAVAGAIRKILEDRERARAMGERGRYLVEQEFDNSIYLDRLAGVLHDLVRPDPAPKDIFAIRRS